MDFLGGVLPAKPKKNPKAALECMECGKLFSARIPASYEVECPKCGSVDIEVA